MAALGGEVVVGAAARGCPSWLERVRASAARRPTPPFDDRYRCKGWIPADVLQAVSVPNTLPDFQEAFVATGSETRTGLVGWAPSGPQVRIWSTTVMPPSPDVEGWVRPARHKSIARGFMVDQLTGRLWRECTDFTGPALGLRDDNSSFPIDIENAISGSTPFLVRDPRPDILIVDVDYPGSALWHFLEDDLAEHAYTLIPSGGVQAGSWGLSIDLVDGVYYANQCYLPDEEARPAPGPRPGSYFKDWDWRTRLHLFAHCESPEILWKLAEKARWFGDVRRSIRPPLTPHRTREGRDRLQLLYSQTGLMRLVEGFFTLPCRWSQDELESFPTQWQAHREERKQPWARAARFYAGQPPHPESYTNEIRIGSPHTPDRPQTPVRTAKPISGRYVIHGATLPRSVDGTAGVLPRARPEPIPIEERIYHSRSEMGFGALRRQLSRRPCDYDIEDLAEEILPTVGSDPALAHYCESPEGRAHDDGWIRRKLTHDLERLRETTDPEYAQHWAAQDHRPDPGQHTERIARILTENDGTELLVTASQYAHTKGRGGVCSYRTLALRTGISLREAYATTKRLIRRKRISLIEPGTPGSLQSAEWGPIYPVPESKQVEMHTLLGCSLPLEEGPRHVDLLRRILQTRAFYIGGLSASVLKVLVGRILGIPWERAGISRSSYYRSVGKLEEIGISLEKLPSDEKLVKRLRRYAKRRGLRKSWRAQRRVFLEERERFIGRLLAYKAVGRVVAYFLWKRCRHWTLSAELWRWVQEVLRRRCGYLDEYGVSIGVRMRE